MRYLAIVLTVLSACAEPADQVNPCVWEKQGMHGQCEFWIEKCSLYGKTCIRYWECNQFTSQAQCF